MVENSSWVLQLLEVNGTASRIYIYVEVPIIKPCTNNFKQF